MHGNTAAKPQKIRSLQVLYHPCGNIVKIFGAEHSHIAVFPCLTEARHRAGKLDLRMVMLEYTLLNANALERLLLFFWTVRLRRMIVTASASAPRSPTPKARRARGRYGG